LIPPPPADQLPISAVVARHASAADRFIYFSRAFVLKDDSYDYRRLTFEKSDRILTLAFEIYKYSMVCANIRRDRDTGSCLSVLRAFVVNKSAEQKIFYRHAFVFVRRSRAFIGITLPLSPNKSWANDRDPAAAEKKSRAYSLANN
jgi:hypothetical protein